MNSRFPGPCPVSSGKVGAVCLPAHSLREPVSLARPQGLGAVEVCWEVTVASEGISCQFTFPDHAGVGVEQSSFKFGEFLLYGL